MKQKTCKCYMCKKIFPSEQIVIFNDKKYCKSCLEEAQNRYYFAQEICKIFSIKSPGPKMYSQRKNLKKAYGFTDKQIITTLKYLFEVRHCDRRFESLGLISKSTMAEAYNYYEEQEMIDKKIMQQLKELNPKENYGKITASTSSSIKKNTYTPYELD